MLKYIKIWQIQKRKTKAEIEIEISAKIESLFVYCKLKINKTVYYLLQWYRAWLKDIF